MKRLLLLLAAALLVFLACFVWWRSATRAANLNDDTSRSFVITRGQGAGVVAKSLEEKGLIRSNLAFRLYLQVARSTGKIQAGEYRLTPNLTLQQVVLALLSGPQELWVTYPEGFRREEIAAKTIETLEMSGEEAEAFWQEFMQESDGLEGLLFPDTYLFARDVSAKVVVQKLSSTFDNRVTGEMIAEAQKNGLSQNKLVSLASIVERETLTDDERPVVAGILLKRLEAGWALQADATLQYITGTRRCGTTLNLDCDWWKPPTVQDKGLKSAYNTYAQPGLPPAPIANPGLISIKAAIYPEDSPYWFYLHDTKGQIHYAKTIEEHNENITKYLR